MEMKEKLCEAESESSELERKCGYLERSVVKLQKEKKEYLAIILQLTHNSKENKTTTHVQILIYIFLILLISYISKKDIGGKVSHFSDCRVFVT